MVYYMKTEEFYHRRNYKVCKSLKKKLLTIIHRFLKTTLLILLHWVYCLSQLWLVSLFFLQHLDTIVLKYESNPIFLILLVCEVAQHYEFFLMEMLIFFLNSSSLSPFASGDGKEVDVVDKLSKLASKNLKESKFLNKFFSEIYSFLMNWL